MKQLTPDVLQLCTGSSDYDAQQHFENIQMSMDRFAIDDVPKAAAYLATLAIESTRLSKTEESLYYKQAHRLVDIYPRKFKKGPLAHLSLAEVQEQYCCNHAAMSELLYNGYHGRGFIQLTWEENYRLASGALGYDYHGNPDMVKESFHAALVSGWFWQSNGCNDVAHDIREVTARVNGPKLMHLAERSVQYVKNLEFLQ